MHYAWRYGRLGWMRDNGEMFRKQNGDYTTYRDIRAIYENIN